MTVFFSTLNSVKIADEILPLAKSGRLEILKGDGGCQRPLCWLRPQHLMIALNDRNGRERPLANNSKF